jgi:hypothetical protein
MTSTYGFVGWRWDDHQHYVRPLTDRILTTTSSSIVDFCFISKGPLLNSYYNLLPVHTQDDAFNSFLLLAYCRDGQLYLIHMDSTFKQAWYEQLSRAKSLNPSDGQNGNHAMRSTSSNVQRQHWNRTSSTALAMDDIGEMDDDHCFEGMPSSPSNTMELVDVDDESGTSMM